MANYENTKAAFASKASHALEQGSQSSDYPRHGEPADAAATLTLDNELSDMNMRIETLEQLFNQAEYEERYWSVKRDHLADALTSLREAREIVRQRFQAMSRVPVPDAQPINTDKYVDRV